GGRSRRRGRWGLAGSGAPATYRPMSGQPLRRARLAATQGANTRVVTSPPRPRAGLSPVAWRRLSPVEKLQALYGLSLDAALEDLSYRGDEIRYRDEPRARPSAPPRRTFAARIRRR